MKPMNLDQVKIYIEQNIGTFHASRLQSLHKLKIEQILKRKNPYLFKAKNILIAQDLVKPLLDAHLSSQEETIFGDFLEGLAIFVSSKMYGGKKSSTEGIDLEFEKDSNRYIVAVKSGPNWGNSSQIRRMREDFNRAKRIVRTGNSDIQLVAVNGCCYGRDNHPDKGDYFKYCGQQFWQFISDNPNLYIELIVPLGHKAKVRNEEFHQEYARIVNKFTAEFSEKFCLNGEIQWDALVRFNSSIKTS